MKTLIIKIAHFIYSHTWLKRTRLYWNPGYNKQNFRFHKPSQFWWNPSYNERISPVPSCFLKLSFTVFIYLFIYLFFYLLTNKKCLTSLFLVCKVCGINIKRKNILSNNSSFIFELKKNTFKYKFVEFYFDFW